MTPLLLLVACHTDGKPAPADSPSPADSADTGDSGEADTAEPEDTYIVYDTDTAVPDPCAPGPDGDGDGWTEDGGDCDDCDAIAYPGAPELCDGVDQDCDGVPILPGGCAEGIDLAQYPALAGWAGTVPDAYVGASYLEGAHDEDLLLFGSLAFELPDGTFSYSFGVTRDMPAGARRPFPEGASLVTWPPDGFYPYPPAWSGDHDGDGRDDVAFCSPGGEYSYGGLFLIRVPEEGQLRGAYDEVARAWMLAPTGDFDLCADYDSSGDLDGDGLEEMVVLTYQRWDGSGVLPSRVYIVRGRADLDGELDPLGEVVLTGEDDGLDVSYVWTEHLTNVWALPDIDGDGAEEMMVGHGGDYPIGSGADLMAGDGSTFRELFTEVSVPNVHTRPADDYRSPGDWDGDGTADLGWVQMGDVDEDDCLYVVSLPAPYADGVLDETLQQLCMPGAHADGYLAGTHDLDGDGLLDPVFRWSDRGPEPDTGFNSTQFLVPTTWLDGGRAEVVDVGIRIGLEGVGGSEKLDFADLDDDGFPELISDHYDGSDPELPSAGWVRILPGFDIPFDDPTMWTAP